MIQQTCHDMIDNPNKIQYERDLCLNIFVEFGKLLKQQIFSILPTKLRSNMKDQSDQKEDNNDSLKLDKINNKNDSKNNINDECKSRNELKESLLFENEESLNQSLLFFDIIDPMTGYPMFCQRGSSIYDEIDGGSRLLRLKITTIGKCGVLTHPKWQSHMYPATMFTNATIDDVKKYIQSVDCKKLFEKCKQLNQMRNSKVQIQPKQRSKLANSSNDN